MLDKQPSNFVYHASLSIKNKTCTPNVPHVFVDELYNNTTILGILKYTKIEIREYEIEIYIFFQIILHMSL